MAYSCFRAARQLRAYLPLLAGVAAGLLHAGSAAAYGTESVVSDPCHETITMNALRRVRAELPEAAPFGASRDERALIDDVPFDLDRDLRDIAAATLILANREVDLKGNSPNDLDELATVHGNPANQDEHCLRGSADDEPEGSRRALEACRAFILSKVDSALDGLDASGAPDPNLRSEIDVFLQIRGSVDADLPHFYVEMGRALHTLQDGFSHTYRTEDQRQVVAVLNYVDYANEHIDEERDGPAHSSPLDSCKGLDERREARLQLAVQASYELLRAVLRNGTREQKRAEAEQVILNYLSLSEDAQCSAANNWCDAPEADYTSEEGCVCTAVGTRTPASTSLAGLVTVALALGLRRSRQRRRALRASAGVSALVLMLGSAGAAHAQTEDTYSPSAPPSEVTPPPPSDVTAPETAPPAEVGAATSTGTAAVDGSDATPGVVDASPVSEVRKPFPLGAYIAGGASVLNGAYAASIGVRYRLSSHFLIGVDGEYNPWFSMHDIGDVRPGSTNVYATGIVRFPLRFQRVNLRSTLQLGVSRMNFDLYGVPKGSVGPYVGFNLLGIDVELSRSIYLVVDPAHIALPIPQTTGVPYVYPQYRFTLGLQFGA